jgi:hypothetical protein
MIYFYVKRHPKAAWDEVTFPLDALRAASRFWTNCLLHGYLIERVGSRR